MNDVIWNSHYIFEMNNEFFEVIWASYRCLKSRFHETIKYCPDRNAAFLKNTNVYAYFLFRIYYPSPQGLLPLWKKLQRFSKIYGRQNALVLKECYAHLRVLLYTFSKECSSVYRRMLHRGMPQFHQEMPSVLQIFNDDLWEACCGP